MQLYLISPLTSTLLLVLAICESYGTSIHYSRMNYHGKKTKTIYDLKCFPKTIQQIYPNTQTHRQACDNVSSLPGWNCWQLQNKARCQLLPIAMCPSEQMQGPLYNHWRLSEQPELEQKVSKITQFFWRTPPPPFLQVYQPVNLDLESLR